MRRLTVISIIAMAAMLIACGHRAFKSGGSSDSIAVGNEAAVDGSAPAFDVDSVGRVVEDSMASVDISVDWPAGEQGALADSVRHYISGQLAIMPFDEEKLKVRIYDDGETAVRNAAAIHHDAMTAMWKSMLDDGWPGGMPFNYYLRVEKEYETERYVTYTSTSEGYSGGAHGFAKSTGITFRKSDGKRIGYSADYDTEKERYVIKNQTLFADASAKGLAALIKEGVKSYFGNFDVPVTNDAQLKELLIGIDNVNRIPLPANPPYFTKDGLSFTYQQYEIAAYAVGLVGFTVPYDKVRQFLTKDAQEMIAE